jgi:hypothetical protein
LFWEFGENRHFWGWEWVFITDPNIIDWWLCTYRRRFVAKVSSLCSTSRSDIFCSFGDIFNASEALRNLCFIMDLFEKEGMYIKSRYTCCTICDTMTVTAFSLVSSKGPSCWSQESKLVGSLINPDLLWWGCTFVKPLITIKRKGFFGIKDSAHYTNNYKPTRDVCETLKPPFDIHCRVINLHTIFHFSTGYEQPLPRKWLKTASNWNLSKSKVHNCQKWLDRTQNRTWPRYSYDKSAYKISFQYIQPVQRKWKETAKC